jgi:hypothetical protein
MPPYRFQPTAVASWYAGGLEELRWSDGKPVKELNDLLTIPLPKLAHQSHENLYTLVMEKWTRNHKSESLPCNHVPHRRHRHAHPKER